MNRQEAKRLIEETFQRPFDEGRFRYFIRNLLNDIDESKAFEYHGPYIPIAFKGYIKQYKRIGKYTDPEGNELDVLTVHLKKETSLDRARTMQRNFVAHYLKKRGEKDAALVAFYNDKLKDWRFSFVRMEYRTVQTESGRVKVREELTPARRYSFLVGENEPNHTAQQQLVPILEDDRHNPALADLEQAFNIETVTREFFLKYRGLFLKVKEELDDILSGNRKIRKEFESKQIDTANFAKKLLGQIVFLYFLQKKGWLGVERGQPWGTGPRNFLRKLFEKEIVDYNNYFNDILEPLFYEALAIDRGEDSFYERFNCKIPFLNGGLFEPIGDYDWENTDILLKNETFREILDTFDLYNFTVREDEPLEKEVAVDPEMLGKVFENLLEVKDRKSKGAYYTPREIVHYMCQESLINYLDTAINTREESLVPQKAVQKSLIGDEKPEQPALTTRKYEPVVPREDIEEFIRHGEFAIDNDTAKIKGTKTYSYKLPESIRKHAKLIDEKLADIKICDPAIGSGAFPVGMMHEIVKARQILTTYLGKSRKRTPYYFKRHAIQNSIYGVDIDPGAIDIAKLRLWLSLVVDEDDYKSIKPLPNLDYKIVCGNSLLGVEQNLLNNHLFRELEKLKPQYFEETDPEKKKELKARIDSLIKEITNNDEHFDFRVYFSEVFHSSPNSPLDKGGKGGFDVVIANPPYVDSEHMTKSMPELREKISTFYSTAKGNWDLFIVFVEKGIKILRDKGILTFIIPNKIISSKYSESLRRFLCTRSIKEIRDYSRLGVFIDQDVYPVTIILVNTKPDLKNDFTKLTSMESVTTPKYTNIILTSDFTQDIFWDRYFFDKPILDLLIKLWKNPTLINFVKEILGAATVNEAYQIKTIIFDSKYGNGYKLINTGAIEPYYSLWGSKKIKYIKSSYLHPRVKASDLKKINILREKQARSAKIIIGGMSNRLEAIYDEGEYLAGKSTTIIIDDVKDKLKVLTAIINSKLMSFFVNYFYYSLKMAGGCINFSTNIIKNLPLKIHFNSYDLLALVNQILSITQDDDYLQNPEKQAKVKELEREIDRIVYELYELTPEEIEIVEGRKQ